MRRLLRKIDHKTQFVEAKFIEYEEAYVHGLIDLEFYERCVEALIKYELAK